MVPLVYPGSQRRLKFFGHRPHSGRQADPQDESHVAPFPPGFALRKEARAADKSHRIAEIRWIEVYYPATVKYHA
jgi:hypothetical protein